MKKILLVALLIGVVVNLAKGQTRVQGNARGAADSISGIYSLYRLEDSGRSTVGKMVITVQKGGSFLIWGPGWGGEGKVEGTQGYYDWKFDDGRTGRTTFVINSDGTLKGHVLGSGLDWWYMAHRAQTESKDKTGRDPETQKTIDGWIIKLQDKDNLLRGMAINKLVGMGVKEIIPALVQLLQDKEGMIRCQAAIGLGKLGAIEVLPELRKLLMDEDGGVRAGAATSIGLLGYKNEAVIYLKKLLSDKSPRVRGGAAVGLGELRVKEAIPDIVNLLKKTVPNVVNLIKQGDAPAFMDIMFSVDKLGAREASPELLKILKELMVHRDSPDSRMDIDTPIVLGSLVRILGYFRVQEAIPDLIKLLSDKNESVRMSTVLALGRLGAKDATPELVKLLKDPNGDTRGLAAIVLVEFGAKDKVPQEIIKDIESIIKWGGEYKTRANFALKELGVTK